MIEELTGYMHNRSFATVQIRRSRREIDYIMIHMVICIVCSNSAEWDVFLYIFARFSFRFSFRSPSFIAKFMA